MSSQSIRITLVRHGESVANRALRWQGQGDSPLSELGQSQARALAERLRARTFDCIVASDLERASATARALARPFERDRDFREFHIGAWEGLTREEVAERFAGELERIDAGEDIAIGGGESYAGFCARVDAALVRLRARLAPGQHALVVCHGGVIGALIAGVLGLRGARELPIARVFNTSITEVAYDAEGAGRVRVFNDSLHLGGLALFPHPVEMVGAVALVCESAPAAAYGSFGAHYEYEGGLAPLIPEASTPSLRALVDAVRARHPDQRVALSASAARIHGWARETVWSAGADRDALAAPAGGSLCHIGVRGSTFALLDYGLTP